MIIQPLVLKRGSAGRYAQLAPKLQPYSSASPAPPSAAQLRSIGFGLLSILAEHGTERLARCLIRAVRSVTQNPAAASWLFGKIINFFSKPITLKIASPMII